MNTTMCSTSRIVPVPRAAGIASARRIDSGNALSATAAPADCATVCRKRRRLDDVMLFHLGSAMRGTGTRTATAGSVRRRCGDAGCTRVHRGLRVIVVGRVMHDRRRERGGIGRGGVRAGIAVERASGTGRCACRLRCIVRVRVVRRVVAAGGDEDGGTQNDDKGNATHDFSPGRRIGTCSSMPVRCDDSVNRLRPEHDRERLSRS
ncbi:hypothetical protein BLAT2472_60378 [Burkholderia latens]